MPSHPATPVHRSQMRPQRPWSLPWSIQPLPSLLLLGLVWLSGCAPLIPTPTPAPSGEKRYGAAELRALRAADFSWPAASNEGERLQREAALARLRAGLALPPGPERDAALPGLMQLVAYYNAEIDVARPLLLQALPALADRDVDVQRALLTAAYTLYAQESAPHLWPLLPKLSASKPFAIAAYTLLSADPADGGTAPRLREQLERQFPAWEEDARLVALMQRLLPAPGVQPALVELLAAPLRDGYPVIFSLQRPGRDFMGLALVRRADGRFVREADGRLFASPQLARARSGLPGTITNGNTPQGVFTLVGAGTATNPDIGPVPYLHSKLPIEATVAEFEHADMVLAWSAEVYNSFLPSSWQAWGPIHEAWLAGRAGRDEILVHGNTISPAYYAGSPFFPGAPQAGCLVSHEDWDPLSGRLLASRQLRLAQVYAAAGGPPDLAGYLVVVEIGAPGSPVSLAEAQALVEASGR